MTQEKENTLQNKENMELLIQNEKLRINKIKPIIVIKKEKIKKVGLNEFEKMSIPAMARTAFPGFALICLMYFMCNTVMDFSYGSSLVVSVLTSLICVGYKEKILAFLFLIYEKDIPSLSSIIGFVRNFGKNKYSVKKIFSKLSFKQKKENAEVKLNKEFFRQQDVPVTTHKIAVLNPITGQMTVEQVDVLKIKNGLNSNVTDKTLVKKLSHVSAENRSKKIKLLNDQ